MIAEPPPHAVDAPRACPAPATRPDSVVAIFEDHVGRRLGLLAALTRDLSLLFGDADPGLPSLCLSASPDGTWRLTPPHAKVPPSFPEPCLGVNFARDGMARADWAALLAAHCDAWLRGVASFQAAAASLTAKGRGELFGHVNALETLYGVVRAGQQAGGAGGAAGAADAAGAAGAAAAGGAATRPPGRPLSLAEVTPALRGAAAALYWPDDDRWYPVTVAAVAPRARTARVRYATGEFEALDLDEVMAEGHMVLTDRAA